MRRVWQSREELFAAIEHGEVTVMIDATYPLSNVHHALESAPIIGKVALLPQQGVQRSLRDPPPSPSSHKRSASRLLGDRQIALKAGGSRCDPG